MNGEVSILDFAQLIYLINFESDRQIWSHIILIADLLTRVPTPILPNLQIPMTQEKRSTTTLLRNVAEQPDYDSTSVRTACRQQGGDMGQRGTIHAIGCHPTLCMRYVYNRSAKRPDKNHRTLDSG